MKFTIFSLDKKDPAEWRFDHILKGFSKTINLNLKDNNYLGFVQLDANSFEEILEINTSDIFINFNDIFLEINFLRSYTVVADYTKGRLITKRYLIFSDIQTKKSYYIIISSYHKNQKKTYSIFLKEIK